MKAQLFFLNFQQDLQYKITDLLRKHIYRGMRIDVKVIDNNYIKTSKAEEKKNFKDYLDLLKASVLKLSNFNLLITDNQGNYGYVEPEENTNVYLTLSQSSMTSVFPAIAVMNRMVMVPQEIYNALGGSKELLLPKPLNLQGMLLVNFQDAKAVDEGIQKVGIQLKIEIAELCRRHMFMNKILRPDFDNLAKLLEIDKGFLDQHRADIFVPSVKLTPKIISGPVPLARYSKVILEIYDETGEVQENVCVQVKAPSGTLKGVVAEHLDFSKAQPRIQKIQFEVFPNARPFCPLEVMFLLDEASEHYAPFPISVILDVI